MALVALVTRELFSRPPSLAVVHGNQQMMGRFPLYPNVGAGLQERTRLGMGRPGLGPSPYCLKVNFRIMGRPNLDLDVALVIQWVLRVNPI